MPASKAKKKKSGGAGLAVFNRNQLKQLREPSIFRMFGTFAPMIGKMWGKRRPGHSNKKKPKRDPAEQDFQDLIRSLLFGALGALWNIREVHLLAMDRRLYNGKEPSKGGLGHIGSKNFYTKDDQCYAITVGHSDQTVEKRCPFLQFTTGAPKFPLLLRLAASIGSTVIGGVVM